jgi:2-oxoglutarate dehydrogenase E2 component (dihydrolipoamide succinyltransferase)
LFEVSTDKVDTEVPSPIAGVLTEIRVPEGETVPVGAVIGVVGDAGAVVAAPPATAPAPVVEAAPAPVATPVVAAPAPAVTPAAGNDNRLLSPVVRRLVNEHNLSVDSIAGTGPGGRITREDVLDHIDKIANGSAPAAAPAPRPAAASPAPVVAAPSVAAPIVRAGERDDVVPLSKIRQLTGAHMTMSLSVSPHAFSVVEVDYANVDNTRAKTKDEFKSAEGFSLTYLPFISRAVVDALADFPNMNASISGTDLIVHRYVDLGIAVDIEGLGLLVPVVRSAEGKRLRAIAREISDLATRAKTRKLSPDEIQGGTFTISNNGSAGSVLTMAIINQPQVAILSTDAIVRKPVVVNVPGGGESIAIHPVGHLAMSWDHRAFDGAYAASFLVRVKEILETRDWSSEF